MVRVTADRYVIYVRVSTKEQGQGWSLDAQKMGCREYLGRLGGEIVGVYSDLASGTKANRKGLADALTKCANSKASLVVWDLDRLGRSIAHLSAIRDSGIALHVARLAKELSTVEYGMFATLAQDEHERISRRVKEGLTARERATGEVNGGIRISADGKRNVDKATEASALARKENAIMISIDAVEVIRELRRDGLSLREIAAKLERMKIKTARGGEAWTASNVSRILKLHGSVE